MLELKRIITKTQRYDCISCGREFPLDEIRVKWRLRLQRSDNYLSGMFWTTQCESCFRTTVQMWINDLNSILQ